MPSKQEFNARIAKLTTSLKQTEKRRIWIQQANYRLARELENYKDALQITTDLDLLEARVQGVVETLACLAKDTPGTLDALLVRMRAFKAKLAEPLATLTDEQVDAQARAKVEAVVGAPVIEKSFPPQDTRDDNRTCDDPKERHDA